MFSSLLHIAVEWDGVMLLAFCQDNALGCVVGHVSFSSTFDLLITTLIVFH